jgi:hypothetical protein
MTFNGFTPPVSNYFRMPNEWINICAEITNLAELKVVQYVLRHTWGYHEYDGQPKPITIDEFMHGRKRKNGTRIDKGTGLSEMSVRNGLEKAIEHGYIICESDERDKARIKKSYKLNMLTSGVQDLDPKSKKSGVQDLGDEVQNLDLQTQDLDLGTKKVRPRSEKETKEKNSKKNTKERKNGTSQQEVNVTTREESFQSINQSSFFSQQSSSQGTKREKKPKVIFSPEAERIMEFAKKLNLVALKWDENHKGYCDTLLEKGIATFEQLESLMRYCEQLPQLANKVDKKICLKNLAVNALPGWLQAQQSVATTLPGIGTRVVSSYDDDDFVDNTFYEAKVSDKELAEKVRETSHMYRDSENFEAHWQNIKSIKSDTKLSNYCLHDKIINARRMAPSDQCSIDDFFYELRRMVS